MDEGEEGEKVFEEERERDEELIVREEEEETHECAISK